jgi:hypothetical protein
METPRKKGRGRPPKGSSDKKAGYLDVRLNEVEKATFKDAADVAGVPLSTWVRERLRSAARRELIEAGQPVKFLMQRGES